MSRFFFLIMSMSINKITLSYSFLIHFKDNIWCTNTIMFTFVNIWMAKR